MVAGVVQRSMSHLRADVETKLHRLPLRYVDRQPRGDLLSRVTNDIDNLQQSLQQTMSQLLTSTLSMMAVLVMMFTISWTLALIALITVPVSIFSIKMVTKRSKAKFTDQWRHTGMLNAQVEEAFTGHALVKVFGRQRDVEETFRAKNDELFEAGNAAQFISGTIQPMMMFFGNLNYVAIALIGGLRVSSGQMSIGDIQAFIQYSRQFTQPLTQLASMINVMQSGIASAERVFELLDVEEESTDAEHPLTDPDPAGRVEFDHVQFSYDPKKPLITDLSLVAEPGETIAIVGSDRRGEDHARQPADAVLRARRRHDPPRRPGHRADDPRRAALQHGHGAPGHLAVRRDHPREHPVRTPRRDRGRAARRRAAPPTSTGSCTRSPTGTTPSSTTTAAP